MAVEIEAHLNTYMFESRLSAKHLFTTSHALYYAIWYITREWWFKWSRIKIVHISTEMSHMSSTIIICNTLHTIQSQSPHKMPKLRIFKPLSCRFMTAFHLGCTPPYSSKLGHRHVVHVIWSRSLATVHPGNNSLASRLCHFGVFYDIKNQMETFVALLALCAGNSPVTGEFPSQKPVTRTFDVFSDLCLNK